VHHVIAQEMALFQHHHLMYPSYKSMDPMLDKKKDKQIKQAPPPKDCFRLVQCTEEKLEEYEEIVLNLLSNTLERMRNESMYVVLETSWQNTGITNGFKKFTKRQEMAQHYRLQGTIHAQMATLMNFFYPKNDDQELMKRRELIYGDALDAKNLYTWKKKNPNRPFQYLGIQWEAINLSSFNPFSKRDFCYLEFIGTTRDLDGQPIGFRITHGIDLPECPSLMETHGLLRTQMTEVMILRPCSNSFHTEVIIDGSWNAPSWSINSFLSTIATNLDKLPLEIQSRLLSSLHLVDKKKWASSSECKNCNVCFKKFGLLTKRHHCRLCGEVLCGSCILSRQVYDSNSHMNIKTKFCKKCIVLVSAQVESDSFYEPPMEDFESFCALMRHGKESSSRSTISILELRRSIVEQIVDKNTNRHSVGSTSVFLPSHRLQADIDLLGNWKEVARSSSKYSDHIDSFIDKELSDNDSMIEVDTKDMLLSNTNGNENNTNGNVNGNGCHTIGHRFSSSTTATMMSTGMNCSTKFSMTGLQDVEESIYQQKVILKEMISKAKAMSKIPPPTSSRISFRV
jgi:hypothetical protein